MNFVDLSDDNAGCSSNAYNNAPPPNYHFGGTNNNAGLCALSGLPLTDPVKNINCQHKFNRNALENYMRRHRQCPICRMHLKIPGKSWIPKYGFTQANNNRLTVFGQSNVNNLVGSEIPYNRIGHPTTSIFKKNKSTAPVSNRISPLKKKRKRQRMEQRELLITTKKRNEETVYCITSTDYDLLM